MDGRETIGKNNVGRHPRFHFSKTPGREAYSSACRPNGPTVNSQGCKPLVRMWNKNVKAPPGRKSCRPVGASIIQRNRYQGLSPWLLTAAAVRLKSAGDSR